jgi:hypothetical protein
MMRYRPRRRCLGQAAIEYLVVLAFGVIVLLKPFSYDDVTSPGAPANEAPALQQLSTAIKDYHKHYTYAMAIAAIPDCDYQFAYDKSAKVGDVATLTGGIAVGFDRCIDWSNPTIPGLSVSGTFGADFNVPTSIKEAIGKMVTDMIDSALKDFLNPAGFLGDMLGFPTSASGILDLILP